MTHRPETPPSTQETVPLRKVSWLRNVVEFRPRAFMTVGEERREIELVDTDFSLPSLLFAGDMYLTTGQDGLQCRRAKAGSLASCTLEDVQLEVDKAQR